MQLREAAASLSIGLEGPAETLACPLWLRFGIRRNFGGNIAGRCPAERLVAFHLFGKAKVCRCQMLKVGTDYWINLGLSQGKKFNGLGSIVVPRGH